MFTIFNTLIVMCLISITSARTNNTLPYTIAPFETSPGLYYETIGKLHLQNDFWKLLVYVDLKNYSEEYNTILKFYDQILNLCVNSRLHNAQLPLCEFYHNKALNVTLQNINSHVALTSELLGKEHRNKRGLFNAIGTISKTLFGTLDADDAKFYSDHISQLETNQNHLLDLLKQQTSIIKSTVHATSLMHQQNYLKHFNEKFTNISHALEEIQSDIIHLENDELINSKLEELVSIFEIITVSYQFRQTELLTIVTEAQKGIISPLVLSPSLFINETHNYEQHITGLSFPVIPKLENIHVLYNLINTNVFSFKDKLCFVLFIPLVESRTYDVLKLSSLPTQLSHNNYVFITPRNSYLIIDSVKQHYFFLSQSELLKCQSFLSTHFLCPQTKPLYLVHLHGECEANLFAVSPEIPSSCNKRIAKLYHPIFIQLANANSWLYTVPKEETLDINCNPTDDRIVVKLKGTGLLTLNSTCSASTKTLTLNPHSQFSSNMLISYTPPLDLTVEINPGINFKTVPKFKLNNSIVIDTNDIGTLNELSDSLQSLENAEKFEQSNNFESHQIHHILTYVIIFVIILSYLSYKLYFHVITKCKKNKPQQTNAESPSDETVGLAENCTNPNPRYNFQN